MIPPSKGSKSQRFPGKGQEMMLEICGERKVLIKNS
jgi:hypothetical protein